MNTTRANPAGPPSPTVQPASGGIGRPSSTAAEAVSDAMRRGDGQSLDRRRRVAGWRWARSAASSRWRPTRSVCCVTCRTRRSRLGLRHGRRLPRGIPAVPHRRCRPKGSAATRDAVVGFDGPDDPATTKPWVPIALAAKVAFDAAGAIYLTLEQLTKHRRVCTYCTAASMLTLAMLPAAVPEAAEAWPTWRRD